MLIPSVVVGAIRRLLRHRSAVAAVVVVGLAGSGTLVYARRDPAATQYRTASAAMGTVTQTIALSGNLAAVGESDLDFGTSGRVASVGVQVGQTVTAGQAVAALDTAALQGSLTQAQAALGSARARLALDQAGPTAQSLAQARAAVSSAQVGLQNARTSLADTQLVNQQSLNQAQAAVTAAQDAVGTDNANATRDCTTQPPTQQCTAEEQQQTRDQDALATATMALAATQAKVQQSGHQAEGQVSSAEVGLANAESALSALEQGTSPEQIQMDQSQVAIDQVNVDNATRTLASATLTAPSAGVVASVGVTVGQNVSGGAASSSSSSSASTAHAVVILTPGALQVTGTVTDSQVGEVAVGQRARVTPAGSTEALNGRVTAIAPEATVSSGVATFAVTVGIDAGAPSLRVGTSASISVVVNQVVDVLTVPTSAVQTSAAGSTVQVMVGGQPQARTVQVGAADPLRTQIVSGLSPGDTVVIATVSSSVPANTAGGGLFGGGGRVTGGGAGGGGRGPGG